MAQLSKSRINALRGDLITFNDAYRKGEPLITDIEYDHLVEVLRVNSPEDDFFKKGVVEKPAERMQKLPLPMYSLEKLKTVEAFRKWLEKMSAAGCREIVATPKFDGISLIVDEIQHKAWTRGDGIEGQRSDKHFFEMNSSTVSEKSLPLEYTWGEAIMKKTAFAHLKENYPDFSYKNARNMVAGLFNAPNGWESPFISEVDFVRYGCDCLIDKDKQLVQMRELYGKSVSASIEFYVDELLELTNEELDMVLEQELHDRFDSEYKIDGVVLEVNEYDIRESLGRLPNGNPAYAIAFKKEAWCDVYQTKVLGDELGVGKTGVINPVILIEPVEINGATVSRVTGYNMAYMIDNHICEGALIEVTRGGDVIPKHLKTLEYSEDNFTRFLDEVAVCPSCGETLAWDETQINLVCSNSLCKERVISELTYFFRTMGCEEFEEPTIRKLYDEGFTTLDDILELKKETFQAILGRSAGRTVFEQIEKVISGVPLARYMAALNIFNGKIAETTCQKILDACIPPHLVLISQGKFTIRDADDAYELQKGVEKIPGIGRILAATFVEGLIKYKRVVNPKIQFSYLQTPKAKVETEGERIQVCFTGFRDKALEEALTAKGHVVLNGVTKECNLLVVADMSSTSSKMKTAMKRGIKIVTRECFINEIMAKR